MYVYSVYLHINVPTLDTSNKEDLSNIFTGHWAAIIRSYTKYTYVYVRILSIFI